MLALIRSLGPLWQAMVQADVEYLEGHYPRFHDHDGLVMLAAQLKHPSLMMLFLDSRVVGEPGVPWQITRPSHGLHRIASCGM